jgi:hypothetical protein
MVKQNKKECKCHSSSGLFIPAGLFIGLGLGFVLNRVVAGIFLGLGAGFICMAIARSMCKCNYK